MIKVGLIGIGGMGRTHFGCYGKNPGARVAAICDIDPRKLAGDWGSIGLNVDTSKTDFVDLSGIETFDNYRDFVQSDVDAIDICLPTPLHAEVTIAALQAGKHVLCEKPMAMSLEECDAMQNAAQAAGKKLLIGHCLRYWPHYVKAHEIISSGEYGAPFYARFQRSGDTPVWSWDDWLRDGKRSGGAVYDMHIHDVDTALWWFGKPDEVRASGTILNDLPLRVDSQWRFDNGPQVTLYGGWDHNGGPFHMSFEVAMEKGTVAWESLTGDKVLLHTGGETREIEVDRTTGYQYEIDDFVAALSEGRELSRVTPQSSRLSVETTLEELRQIRGKQ